MHTAWLLVLTMFQVLLFQLVLAERVRTLTDVTVGLRDLPEETVRRLEAYHRRVRGVNRALAVILVTALAVGLFAFPVGPSGRRLLLALVSLASSSALAGTMLRNRSVTFALVAALPDSGPRSASLERRSLGRYYPLAWEWLAAGLFVATLGFTVWAVGSSGGAATSTGRLWATPVVQLLFLVLLYVIAMNLVHGHHYVPHNAPGFPGGPERGLELEDALRGLKLRAILAVKILGMLAIGLHQVLRVQELRTGAEGAWFVPALGAVVVVMIVNLALFLVRVSAVRRSLAG